MMNEEGGKLVYQSKTFGETVDGNGKVLKQYNKQTTESFNFNEIPEDNRVAIDAMMMTNSIIKSNFKKLLIDNIGKDFPYTTGLCRQETIGNLIKIKKISQKQAESEFFNFKEEINLKFLEYKDEYFYEGENLYKKVIASGLKIKNIRTFKKDCVNLVILEKNNISDFFSNDEELKKVCNKFNIKINFISIPESNEKIIKNWKKEHYKYPYYPKEKYGRMGRRAKK